MCFTFDVDNCTVLVEFLRLTWQQYFVSSLFNQNLLSRIKTNNFVFFFQDSIFKNGSASPKESRESLQKQPSVPSIPENAQGGL